MKGTELEDAINALEEMKGTELEDAINPLEGVINVLKGIKRSEFLVKNFINSYESISEAIKPDTLTEVERSELLETAIKSTINALKTLVVYKNFIPDIVNLFGYPTDRKRSIFNAQLCIMTNYPTEDGNTAAYGEVDFLYFQEEVNRSVREVVARLSSPLPQFLESLVYLGPLRRHPERHYEFSGDTTDYVGQSGEYLPSILFEDQELVEQINSDLGRIGVKYQVKLDKLQYEDKSPSNVFSLRLIDKAGIDASLRDVGFGISQVLPIVVQSRLSEKKTLLIEQPEIHLHPAHQAELGDMFIRSALGEQRNTILLETHSEHLMLRILRRIRETSENEPLPEGIPAIRPEDVAVLYVQPGEGDEGAQVIEIPVTADGDFARLWPEGFFVERSKELF